MKTYQSYPALKIAEYFIKKYGKDGDITPMKLLKLIYIAHGWHLALTEQPLITDNIQAWQFGPVIPNVYNEFREYNTKSIPDYTYKDHFPNFNINLQPNHLQEIETSQKTLLDKIWSVYGGYDGLRLSDLTHQQGTPWREVYAKKAKGNITDDLIMAYYKRLQKNKNPS